MGKLEIDEPVLLLLRGEDAVSCLRETEPKMDLTSAGRARKNREEKWNNGKGFFFWGGGRAEATAIRRSFCQNRLQESIISNGPTTY